ncbi:hypothetical protein [Streptomyces sp. NPDC127100]|uniref:hypothetical protein n=1 Tax=Streptomyces sp. NPDC127100 TaxID=3347138 RepID=UPI00365E97AB
MREKPEAVGDTDMRTEVEPRRIDLSVPQVAGSALAAVVAAKLASSFGVYGTILGAGLISVIATCGGSVFQHFFRRTAEQMRTRRAAEAGAATGAGRSAGHTVPAPGEFTEGTVYRARVTNWKRPLVAAALVFGVTMGGITAYEAASGHNLSGGHSTTVGSAFSGHGRSAPDPEEPGGSGDRDESPAPADSQDPGTGDDAPAATPSGTSSGSADGAPSDGTSPDDGGDGPDPAPTSSATGGDGSGAATTPAPDASATTPEPGASSRSGTGDQGQDGPAAP